MNKIWGKWTEHYKNLKIDLDRICKDGIINADEFNKTEPKILFILKETNEFAGGDLRQLFRERVYGVGKMLARWTVGILGKFSTYNKVKTMADDQLKNYLNRTAVINLKKLTGESRADRPIINAYTHQDKDPLQEQIDSICKKSKKPGIIVACGIGIMDSLIWLLDLEE